MKKLLGIGLILLILSGCNINKKNIDKIGNKEEIYSKENKENLVKSNKYNRDFKKKLNNNYLKILHGNQKVLSGVNSILYIISKNEQLFNEKSLYEFKKMISLYKKNLFLMKELVNKQKKVKECISKKNDFIKKDIPKKDIPEKDIPKKDIPEKDIPEKDIPEKDNFNY